VLPLAAVATAAARGVGDEEVGFLLDLEPGIGDFGSVRLKPRRRSINSWALRRSLAMAARAVSATMKSRKEGRKEGQRLQDGKTVSQL